MMNTVNCHVKLLKLSRMRLTLGGRIINCFCIYLYISLSLYIYIYISLPPLINDLRWGVRL